MTVRLVVYGLLRRAGPMSHLLDGSEYLGEVELYGYEMYDLGDFPGAVDGHGTILGELYELPSPAILELLDEAEHVHAIPPLYRRELIDAKGEPAWIYVYDRVTESHTRIPSGDWFNRGSGHAGRPPESP